MIIVSFIITANLIAEDSNTAVDTDYIGKSFDLTFTDLLSGRIISTIGTSDTSNAFNTGSERIGTLIVFWSINCGPCIREIPDLNSLYAQWHLKGLEIIGILQDERPEQVISLCNRFRIVWPQFMESGPPFKKPTTAEWHISHTPDFILLDSDGRVIDYGFFNPIEAVERHFG